MSYADLKGKTYIVTGAASGMGRETALLLAKQGSNVGLLDLRKPDAVAEEVENLGVSVLAVACNVQDRRDVDQAVKAVSDKFGGIDGDNTQGLLLDTLSFAIGGANMAGLVGDQSKSNALSVLDDKFWDMLLKTNLDGVKNSIRAELAHIKQGGAIVNAASIAGQRGSANNPSYAASKWGVIGLTKSVAYEVGPKGIRVNAVAP